MALVSALGTQSPPISPARATALAPQPRAGRDTSIDFVRALCVVGVVVLHAVMVGVTIENGSPLFANASDGSGWIVPLSWVLQVMPLFFVIAGVSARLAYRRHRARGGTGADFVAARLQRLLRPALFAIGIVGALLFALSAAGVPAEFVAVAGFRYGQPLWFLAVFLLCQALVPLLSAAHERAPLTALGSLALTAVAVDVVRTATGVDAIGFINLAFVWLAQQLGFFLADGCLETLSRRARTITALASGAVLVIACALGVFTPDLIANINPPTTALLLVGVSHTALLSLHRGWIRRLSQKAAFIRLTAFVTPRTMTIYLWHMPVLLGMAGVAALLAVQGGLALPQPGTPAWWMQRPAWIIAALLVTAVTASLLARFEATSSTARGVSAARATAAVLLGVVAIAILLLLTTSPTTALLAATLIACALCAVRPVGTSRVHLRRGLAR